MFSRDLQIEARKVPLYTPSNESLKLTGGQYRQVVSVEGLARLTASPLEGPAA
jgi:hypothetical protein